LFDKALSRLIDSPAFAAARWVDVERDRFLPRRRWELISDGCVMVGKKQFRPVNLIQTK
jgi:hypothetical protein